jgi:hypothetical protein
LEQVPRLQNRLNGEQQNQPDNLRHTDFNTGEHFGNDRGNAWLSTAQPWCPDFFGVGPARTATTWLHNVLAAHVNLPEPKETRFIDLYYGRGWPWYRNQFGLIRDDVPSGEIAPTYFHSDLVRARIKQRAPGAKIICTLRDPVERLYSLFRYLRYRGSFGWDFENALIKDVEMVESARYAHYLKAWIADFGQKNVLVTIYDDIEREPQSYIDRIADFIEIPRFTLSTPQNVRVNSSEDMLAPSNYALAALAHLMANTAFSLRLKGIFRLSKRAGLRRLFFGRGRAMAAFDEQLAPSLRKRLTAEVEEVERIIGRDLSAWKA